MLQNKQVPVLQAVNAALCGIAVAGLMTAGNVMIYLSPPEYRTPGSVALASGIGLLLYAVYRTLRARLHSPWLLTLLTAFTVKTVFQEQATTLVQGWITLYASQVDPATGWLILMSGAALIGVAGMAGIVFGTAEAR